MANPAQKPPPSTLPRKVQLPKQSNAGQVVELYLQVTPDGVSSTAMDGAETSYQPVGLIAGNVKGGNPVTTTTPGYEFSTEGKGPGARKTVTKLLGQAQIRVVVTIQTTYGQKAKASDRSAYGRGPTPEDEEKGDTSLGFHEACHRDNFTRFLENENFPVFAGRPGMTVEQYHKEEQMFTDAVQAFFTRMGKQSTESTDNVGYTQAEFSAKGQRIQPKDAGAEAK